MQVTHDVRYTYFDPNPGYKITKQSSASLSCGGVRTLLVWQCQAEHWVAGKRWWGTPAWWPAECRQQCLGRLPFLLLMLPWHAPNEPKLQHQRRIFPGFRVRVRTAGWRCPQPWHASHVPKLQQQTGFTYLHEKDVTVFLVLRIKVHVLGLGGRPVMHCMCQHHSQGSYISVLMTSQ